MLCYSTGSLPLDCDVSKIFQLLDPTPFRGLEWTLSPKQYLRRFDSPYWTNVYTELTTNGYMVESIHLGSPFLFGSIAHNPSLSSPVEKERLSKVLAVLEVVPIAMALHTNRITLTSGPRIADIDLSIQEHAFEKSVELILEKSPSELLWGLEQEPEHTIHSCNQLLKLCNKYNSTTTQRFGANFDIGHAEVVGESISESIEKLLPYLYNIHFEDIKDHIHKHLLFGEGDIDFNLVLDTLKHLKYTGNITPDLYPFAEIPEKGVESSVQIFKNW